MYGNDKIAYLLILSISSTSR